MIRTENRLRLCGVLIFLLLCFIWGNSLLPASVSRAFSDWVQALLSALFSRGSVGAGQGSGLLRKIAHFTEFAALGALLGWLFGMLRKKNYVPFLWGVAAACVDETIQLFVPERGPGLPDVLLDSSGVLAGLILLCFGHSILRKRST